MSIDTYIGLNKSFDTEDREPPPWVVHTQVNIIAIFRSMVDACDYCHFQEQTRASTVQYWQVCRIDEYIKSRNNYLKELNTMSELAYDEKQKARHDFYNHGLHKLLMLPISWSEKSAVIRYISPPLADLLRQFADELVTAFVKSGIHHDIINELRIAAIERFDINEDGSITIPKDAVDYYLKRNE